MKSFTSFFSTDLRSFGYFSSPLWRPFKPFSCFLSHNLLFMSFFSCYFVASLFRFSSNLAWKSSFFYGGPLFPYTILKEKKSDKRGKATHNSLHLLPTNPHESVVISKKLFVTKEFQIVVRRKGRTTERIGLIFTFHLEHDQYNYFFVGFAETQISPE